MNANTNVEKKHLVLSTSNAANSNDLTSIAVNVPSHPNNLLNNVEENSSRQTLVQPQTGESKRVERTSRKECYRLGRRKLLFEKRRQASDYALFFAMIGLFLMVLEQELTMARVYDKVKKRSLAFRNTDRRERERGEGKYIYSYGCERKSNIMYCIY